MRGRWLVDGQDPSAQTCGNIALVRLNLVDESEEQFWVPAEFSLRCHAEKDENAAIIDGRAYIAVVSFIPAPAIVQTQIGMLPGAVVARYKPDSRVHVAVSIPEDKIEWFRDRSKHPDIAPSSVRLAPDDAIVIMFVVDALRADLLSGDYAEQLPHMTNLVREGVTFTRAYAPAPSTNGSVAALFAGRYPAQLRWTVKSVGPKPRLWPDDSSLGLGDLLSERDVESAVVVGSMRRLKPEHGVTRGQRIEVRAGRNLSRSVVPAWLKWIASNHEGPLFAYLHVDDAHAPYNLGGKNGSAQGRA